MTAPDLEAWRTLRRSGPPLVALGTMNFGRRNDFEESSRILDRALERGVTLLDTANAYAEGEGESFLGELLEGRRQRVLVSSKVGLLRLGGEKSGLLQRGGVSEGLSLERIQAACEESLKRLRTDVIDIYFLHVPDRHTPIEESLEAMSRLLESGKIRAFAASNYASWQMLEMLNWCDANHVARPIQTQQVYNLLVRQLDLEYFPFARKHSLPTVVYNPLAGGLLSGRHEQGAPASGTRFDNNPMYEARYWSPRMFEAVEVYRGLAASAHLSLVELSYAWLAASPSVDAVLVGPSSVEHVDAALDALSLKLDSELLTDIERTHVQLSGTDMHYARI
jgi:aryl-alcohol dehydrogenase-like predicted oxidoreductase